MEAKRYNRLMSTTEIKQSLDANYDSVRRAQQESNKVAWAFGDIGVNHLLTSQGIKLIGLGANAARNGSRGGIKQTIPAAEAAGCLPEQCSYGKIAIGGSILVAEGRGDEIQPDCRVPRADFGVLQTACPVQMYISHNIQRTYDLPVFELDIPSFGELTWLGEGRVAGKEWDRNYAYVLRQLKDLVIFIEEMMGQPYDWDALRQVLASVKNASIARNKILKRYGNAVPSAISFFDLVVGMGMTFGTQRASNSGVEYWERVEQEVADRVKNGIGSVTSERFRLHWHGLPVQFKIGSLARMFASYDATVVCGEYALVDYYPENIDPDQPLESLAHAMVFERSYNHPEEFETERLLEKMKLFAPIHGVVLHVPRTCRSEASRMLHRAKILEKKMGIPTLVLYMDTCDPQFFVDAQVEGSVQAFLELLRDRQPWVPN